MLNQPVSTPVQFHLYILEHSFVTNDKYFPRKLTCLSKVFLFLANGSLSVIHLYVPFVCSGSSVLQLAVCSPVKHNFISLFLVFVLPWGFLETEVPIMEPGAINEVWHWAPEIPELDVASRLLHYSLIKPLKRRCGFCMLMVLKFSVKYTHRDFLCCKRDMGALKLLYTSAKMCISAQISGLCCW